MKNKITCDVIGDMLPLYVDNVLSEDSSAIVENHLEKCKSCRAALEQMESPIHVEKLSDEGRIKNLEKRVSNKRFIGITVLCLAAIVVLIASGVLLGNYFYFNSGDAMSGLRQFWCVCISVFLSIAIWIGWGLYLLYYLGRSREDITASTKKKAITAYIILLIICILFGSGYKLMFYGSPASSKDVKVETEFQYCPGAYLDQSWTIHLDLTNGHAMNVISETEYETAAGGEKRIKGMIYHVRDVPNTRLLETSGWTGGYTSGDGSFIEGNKDFTVTVVYKDKTDVYNLSSEGLFEKQDSVTRYPPYDGETADTPISSIDGK